MKSASGNFKSQYRVIETVRWLHWPRKKYDDFENAKAEITKYISANLKAAQSQSLDSVKDKAKIS